MVVELLPPRKYPGGTNFLVYSADGGSFAYYPSGRMAAAYERMGGGFYTYFYADDKAGTTLLAIDPRGCGYAAFPNGKPRLTSQKTGGVLVDDKGMIVRSWTQFKPLTGPPIEFELSPHLHLSFQSRQLIRAKLSCHGLSQEYELGDVQKMATESYLTKSVGVVKMGPERGKQILDIDQCRQAAQENRARRASTSAGEMGPAKKCNITPDFMQKHPPLREVVTRTDELQRSVKEGKWDVEVFVSKAKLQATLSDDFPSLKFGDSLKGDRYSQKLDNMPALQPDTLEALLKETSVDGRPLPLSASIKAASGRFRPDHGFHYKTIRKRLKLLKDRSFDHFIQSEVPQGTLAVVCCLAGWLPQCRKAEPALELLNGELHAEAVAGEGTKPVADFLLYKFDMSESRLLRDRYNITTLPMYLMYFNGKLCYASNTFKGVGTTMNDLRAQVRDTREAAQRGIFLPDDFKFGLTSNKFTESFQETLAGISTTLAGVNSNLGKRT
ncbi:hypothetical protein AB1Y20_019594 [Prymnesium parvum]|uniref:FAM194 C-terminal domain-containing protein n=1 Tax=Prymnesium parvum TaxID=97485 RepID=A0AB34JVI6_PRYPA